MLVEQRSPGGLVPTTRNTHLVGMQDLADVVQGGTDQQLAHVEMSTELLETRDELVRCLDNQRMMSQEARRSAEPLEKRKRIVHTVQDHSPIMVGKLRRVCQHRYVQRRRILLAGRLLWRWDVDRRRASDKGLLEVSRIHQARTGH